MSYSDVDCPYCGKGNDINHDDGYGYEEGELFEQECGDCGKTFAYSSSMSWNHEAFEAPCLNGEPHKWKQCGGYPAEAFIGRFECPDCGKEERRDEAGRLAALKKMHESYRGAASEPEQPQTPTSSQ